MSTLQQRPQLGVSACLTGQPVRFDGGHKKNAFVLEQCADFFDLHRVCPEVELGLGTPRPAIQLRRDAIEIKLVYSKQPETELTDAMREFSKNRVAGMDSLDGFVFKKDSPSCGVQRVPVVNGKTGQRVRDGIGLFAEAFKEAYPDVPTEDEGRLCDVAIRENFLERVYAHYRWRQIDNPDKNLSAFREFHKNYKLVLMAKKDYSELGRLVATVNRHNLPEVRKLYFRKFMQLMARIPSRGQHVNVLMHCLGYLKHKLDSRDKAELLEWFENYRTQQVNRITPLAILQHHFRHHPDDYIAEQYYFSPFPSELMQPV